METINFAMESLVFQKRLSNGAHSISDIKLPCYYKQFLRLYIGFFQFLGNVFTTAHPNHRHIIKLAIYKCNV